MKKVFYFLFVSIIAVGLASCGDDEAPGLPDGGMDGDSGNEIVSANITEDVTWEKDKIYELATRVIVEPGATLTIEAGTLIKGQPGDGANATALIIARGAKIEANGTATEPIIFTSSEDEIMIGEINSPNLTETDSELWGGLIVLGNAPVSDNGNDGTDQIEGIPGNVSLAEYGGTDAADNSGTLNYVSVRHGGAKLGDGDEINGITLGGVGSGTTITNIEVVANFDDGIEFFGGTVNVNNLLVWAADDDLIDIDQAYSGTITNAIAIAFSGTDHCLEIDGPEGTATGAFTINNLTAKGVDDELADFRDGAMGTVDGAYFFNFVSPDFDTNGEEEGGDGEGDFSLTDSNTNDLTFTTFQITLPEGTTAADVFKDFTAEEVTSIVTVVAKGSETVGGNISTFDWTFASAKGALTDF